MSTTKIFISFGVFVAIITVPLTIIYIRSPIIFGRYINIVENSIVGLIGAYLVAIALDFTLRHRQEKAAEKVARIGLSEASQQINAMLVLFALMVKASSKGFTPSTIEDLFGSKAAELISFHLALGSHGPVVPIMTWQEYISRKTRSLVDELTNIQDRYQLFFPERASVAIAALRNNPLLEVLQRIDQMAQLDAPSNIFRPVLNIPLDNLKPLMNNILISIKQVECSAKKLKTDVMPCYSQRHFDDDVSPKSGSARYDGQLGPSISIGRGEGLPRISPPPEGTGTK